MRDQQRGLAGAFEGLRQLALQHHPGLRVDGRERLVEQEHGRVDRERARERHALPHAARQLVRIVTGELGQVEVFQQRVRALFAFWQGKALDLDAEHHVLEHGPPRQQQILLQHEGDVGVWPFHALAVDEGRALARRVKTRADIEQS